MTRTQIQLPDDLYQRAKTFAAQKEISLAEMTRRGLELFLARFPEQPVSPKRWKMPVVQSGGVQVPLEKLNEYGRAEEAFRSLGSK